MMDVANPTFELGIPRPPPKWKIPSRLSGARGVGRKVKHRALKALAWNPSKKRATSVRRTLRVQIWRNGIFFLRIGAEELSSLAIVDVDAPDIDGVLFSTSSECGLSGPESSSNDSYPEPGFFPVMYFEMASPSWIPQSFRRWATS